jgi:hypothetical protein
VVYEVEVALDVEGESGGYEAVVPGGLDVVREGEDGICSGAGCSATELVWGD